MSTDNGHKVHDRLEGVRLPEQSDTVVGHQAVVSALRQQIDSGRLPGAVLLHGPYGIGKGTTAFSLTRDVLVTTGDEPADRVHEQVGGGVHPNVFVLRRRERDTSGFYAAIRVEDVRDLQQRMRQTRGRAGHRICIIDSIDDCNISAANALLKILEEPPAETVFFLISHRPGRLLPTIRSRCHAYAMRGLGREQLAQVLEAQPIAGADAAAFDRAIALADGRPRRAFEALLLGSGIILEQVRQWLSAPGDAPVSAHLDLAGQIAAADDTEAAFARELIMNRMAEEARQAAEEGARNRLASATELWDKARTLLAEADSYNLDMRQTLVSLFDALRQHCLKYAGAPVG